MENLRLDRKRAIEELERGKDFASQLRRVLQKPNGEDDYDDDASTTTAPFAEDLAEKVQRSFSNALLILNLRGRDSDDVSQTQLVDSCCVVPAKSDESEDSCRSSAMKNRRGSYKRRKTTQTWENESETPLEDSYAWRKYGQKMILNAKYPRNYFRCTHKFDQGCQAIKQVQRIQEEPALYRTTYYGNHTCRNMLNPEIILDSGESPSHSSIILRFDNTLPAKQDHLFPSSSTKQDCKEEIPSSSSDDFLLSPPELTFDSSGHMTLSSTLDSDHRHVFSEGLSVDIGDVFEPFEF